MTVLVTGGTGTLGRALLPLLPAGEVRVLSRGPRPADSPHDWATGDLRGGQGLSDAVAGVDTIVHCATTNGRGDVDGTRDLIAAARGAGRPHVIYVSIVGVDRVPLPYYRAKLESERLIERSDLPWTILRATQFHDLIATMCAAQRWLPALMMPAGVSFQPIDTGDVARRLAELVGPAPVGRAPDIGGPEIHTAVDLARAYLKSTGRRRVVLPVPVPGATFHAYRQGRHLAPEQATGKVTFDEFLAAR